MKKKIVVEDYDLTLDYAEMDYDSSCGITNGKIEYDAECVEGYALDLLPMAFFVEVEDEDAEPTDDEVCELILERLSEKGVDTSYIEEISNPYFYEVDLDDEVEEGVIQPKAPYKGKVYKR